MTPNTQIPYLISFANDNMTNLIVCFLNIDFYQIREIVCLTKFRDVKVQCGHQIMYVSKYYFHFVHKMKTRKNISTINTVTF